MFKTHSAKDLEKFTEAQLSALIDRAQRELNVRRHVRSFKRLKERLVPISKIPNYEFAGLYMLAKDVKRAKKFFIGSRSLRAYFYETASGDLWKFSCFQRRWNKIAE